MKQKYAILPILVFALYSCDPVEPTDPNEEELITTVSVELIGPNSTAVLSYVDLDGDGGAAPVFSVDSLDANTVYSGSITLLNESETPAEDITAEIFDEADDHQFFFTTNGGTNYSYTDQDNNGYPVGLTFELTTGDPGTEEFTFILRHLPAKDADGVIDGDITNAGGETDIEVVFDVIVH
ncbi:MAG: type 1 periplasmic binding fold superfamily protein [Bacteroidetes bacterium]|nr:type 1 periplasmic binding fold superfamily protein [Bacteroidota bacterium]